jgi:hypothetical protein
MEPEDKAKFWLDKLLSDEIALKTFKTGMFCCQRSIGVTTLAMSKHVVLPQARGFMQRASDLVVIMTDET